MENIHKHHNIIKKIKESKYLQVVVCIALSSVVIFAFLILNNYLNFKKSRKYTIVDDIKLVNSIENISINNGNLELEGYAFLLEQDSPSSSISLFMRNVNNGNEVWLDVEQSKRPDVNAYFDSEYNYEYTGFQAYTQENKLTTDECYEVIINIDYKDSNDNKIRKTVSSNTYVVNSELYGYNPYDFNKPDMNIESELLRNVFADGQLCFYQEDAGMYVYQYEGELYWIATEDFEFNENGETYFPYHLYTTQVDKLPTNRIQHKYDNLDFYFEQHEYKDQITKPYRVAIRDIPGDYAITYIKTGVYNVISKQWLWNKSFHLKDNELIK
mgnify:CR=1 FL=1